MNVENSWLEKLSPDQRQSYEDLASRLADQGKPPPTEEEFFLVRGRCEMIGLVELIAGTVKDDVNGVLASEGRPIAADYEIKEAVEAILKEEVLKRS
jgi:hypothetical protein